MDFKVIFRYSTNISTVSLSVLVGIYIVYINNRTFFCKFKIKYIILSNRVLKLTIWISVVIFLSLLFGSTKKMILLYIKNTRILRILLISILKLIKSVI